MNPRIESISPFFIVGDMASALAFYAKLGFESRHQHPAVDPFFAIVGRDQVMLFLKASDVGPLPNPSRDPEMRWDAYLLVPDPDALAAEFGRVGIEFSVPLKDTDDGLRGFEVADPDGYVLFFGRPR